MKLKCTNVLVTIAMICSVLAMIMNWIIYFGPQDKYVQFFWRGCKQRTNL